MYFNVLDEAIHTALKRSVDIIIASSSLLPAVLVWGVQVKVLLCASYKQVQLEVYEADPAHADICPETGPSLQHLILLLAINLFSITIDTCARC